MKLYPFQEEALKLTEGRHRVAYYYDMGLGKTFIGAEKLSRLNANVNLIICQKSKVNDWIEHFQTNYPHFHVFDLTSKKKADRRAVEYGFWMNYRTGSVVPSVLIINYELAWRRPELSTLEGFTLMLDESSMIQNERAKQSKFVLKLNPANMILLSGTPTAGKYENLWSQCHLLGWPISRKAYWNTYIETEYLPGIPVPHVTGYKNVDRLKAKLHEYGAVFKKTDEVMDLPEQNDITISVDASSEYKKFLKECYVLFDDPFYRNTDEAVELIGETSLTKHLHLRQLCGQYSVNKVGAFWDLVQSTNDRLIVFYNFNEELYQMKTALLECHMDPGRISVINGNTKDLTAYENRDDSITFVQYQAGAMGLNLQKANKIIYFTLPERSELFEQSRKRIHRIGQNRPCFYYFLMCKGSIEQNIKKALDMRKDYTDELFRKEFT